MFNTLISDILKDLYENPTHLEMLRMQRDMLQDEVEAHRRLARRIPKLDRPIEYKVQRRKKDELAKLNRQIAKLEAEIAAEGQK